MTDAELLEKCTHLAAAGCAMSAAVLRVLIERDSARSIVNGLAYRVAAQSELLSKHSEIDEGQQ